MRNPVKKSVVINAFQIFMLSAFLLSCEKDNSGPAITNVNGNWSGKSNQNENISFIVSANSVTTFSIKIVTTSFTQETRLWPSDCKVTDNSFSLSGGVSPTLYITGEFKSNTSSEGTFNLGSASGTWTATKE